MKRRLILFFSLLFLSSYIFNFILLTNATESNVTLHYVYSIDNNNTILSMDYSQELNLLAFVDQGSNLFIKNLTTNETKEMTTNGNGPTSFSPNNFLFTDGKWIYTLNNWKKYLAIYHQESDWSPNSTQFATILEERLIIWDTKNWMPIINITVSFGSIVEWSPNGEKLAVLSANEIQIYNTSNFEIINTINIKFDTSTNGVIKGEWTDDSKYLIYSCGEYRVHIYNMSSYSIEKYLYGAAEHISTVTIFNKYIVSGTVNSMIYIWKISSIDPIFYRKIGDYSEITQILPISDKNYIAILYHDSVKIDVFDIQSDALYVEAGNDISIPLGNIAYFDGSKSTGEITDEDFIWHISGFNITLIGKDSEFLFSEVGNYNVTLEIVDKFGNRDTDGLKVVVFDPNRIPTVEIIEPKPKSFVKDIIFIKGNSHDNVKIEFVEIKIQKWGSWQKANGTLVWNYLWNTRESQNGVVLISARAFNGYIYSNEVQISITVNNSNIINPKNVKPMVTITKPVNNDIISGNILFFGLASDDSAVDRVLLEIQGCIYYATGTIHWIFYFDSTFIRDGEQNILIYSIDDEGVYSDILELRLYVNNTGKFDKNNLPPTIKIISPKIGEEIKANLNVQGEASDDKNNILLIQIKFENNTWRSIKKNIKEWNISLAVSKKDNGLKHIYARCFDGVYFSETSSVSIYINTTIKDNAENSNNSNYITNINVFFFPLILILILLVFITILYSYYSFNNRKIINKRRRFRKRRILNVIFIPTISILVIIIFILPFIFSQTFIYLLPFQNKGNEQTSIALKPSITFYSINGSLITNEDLLDHVVLIEFVVAQTIHGKTFTQQLVAIQKDINDKKVIFITIDIENTISETDFKEIYYTELGVNWEIGYNIDKTDRECGVEGKPYSLVILKKDNSIGSQYYEFISTDLVEKQIREYL